MKIFSKPLSSHCSHPFQVICCFQIELPFYRPCLAVSLLPSTHASNRADQMVPFLTHIPESIGLCEPCLRRIGTAVLLHGIWRMKMPWMHLQDDSHNRLGKVFATFVMRCSALLEAAPHD